MGLDRWTTIFPSFKFNFNHADPTEIGIQEYPPRPFQGIGYGVELAHPIQPPSGRIVFDHPCDGGTRHKYDQLWLHRQ